MIRDLKQQQKDLAHKTSLTTQIDLNEHQYDTLTKKIETNRNNCITSTKETMIYKVLIIIFVTSPSNLYRINQYTPNLHLITKTFQKKAIHPNSTMAQVRFSMG